SEADAVLSNVPVLLGERLPQAILDKLTPPEYDVAAEAEKIRANGLTDAFSAAKWLVAANETLEVK
ncbi:MAG: hypothetical protein LBT36_01815, partial [Oscillospiraceae bacterium]|nr:hypothetical protein [Oscillospiraceae bacterium]